MYITTTNPTVTERLFYNGSSYQLCPAALTERFSAGTAIISSGRVTSWRGKKDRTKSHLFDSFEYKTSGCSILDICNVNNRVDGGRYWIHLLNNHAALVPRLVWSPDLFKISEEDENLRKYVIQNLYAKANEARFNSAVFVAELGETIKYVKDILKSFIGVTKLYKAAIERGAKPHSTWLEWRYAIMPMVLTVQDAVTALNVQRPKEKVQAFKDVPDVDTKAHMFTYTYGNLAFNSRLTTSIRSGAAIDIVFQHDSAPWGTSAYDVLMAGWERVTLSFVLDWWLDIGQWLSSFRDTNLIIGDKYATLVKESKLEIWLDRGRCTRIKGVNVAPTELDPFVVQAHHISRLISDDVVPPTLPCFVPGKLSLLRKLDGLSLLIGALLGLKRK